MLSERAATGSTVRSLFDRVRIHAYISCRARIEYVRNRDREGQDTIGSCQTLCFVQRDDPDVSLVCLRLSTDQVLPAFNKYHLRGNATDLSFLIHITLEEINRVQNVGREAQESRQQFILHDDQVRAS